MIPTGERAMRGVPASPRNEACPSTDATSARSSSRMYRRSIEAVPSNSTSAGISGSAYVRSTRESLKGRTNGVSAMISGSCAATPRTPSARWSQPSKIAIARRFSTASASTARAASGGKW